MLDGSLRMIFSRYWRRLVLEGEEKSKRCVSLSGSKDALRRSLVRIGLILCFGLGMCSLDAIS